LIGGEPFVARCQSNFRFYECGTPPDGGVTAISSVSGRPKPEGAAAEVEIVIFFTGVPDALMEKFISFCRGDSVTMLIVLSS
jgi:hypothetical protein